MTGRGPRAAWGPAVAWRDLSSCPSVHSRAGPLPLPSGLLSHPQGEGRGEAGTGVRPTRLKKRSSCSGWKFRRAKASSMSHRCGREMLWALLRTCWATGRQGEHPCMPAPQGHTLATQRQLPTKARPGNRWSGRQWPSKSVPGQLGVWRAGGLSASLSAQPPTSCPDGGAVLDSFSP